MRGRKTSKNGTKNGNSLKTCIAVCFIYILLVTAAVGTSFSVVYAFHFLKYIRNYLKSTLSNATVVQYFHIVSLSQQSQMNTNSVLFLHKCAENQSIHLKKSHKDNWEVVPIFSFQ